MNTKDEVKQLVLDINQVWEDIKNSDSNRILRDSCDGPDWPLAIDICGQWYEWNSAKVEGTYRISQAVRIIIILMNLDDWSEGEEKLYEFPTTLEFLQEYRDALTEYLKG